MESETYFSQGVCIGLILAIALFFALDRIRDNHAEYWRGAFCMEAENPPNFCATDEQFQFYLDTMSMVIESMKESGDEAE